MSPGALRAQLLTPDLTRKGQHANVPRADFDRLKATLTNCIRNGAASQNRTGHEDFRGHLLGRVSFVAMINPARGERLRKLFEQIAW